MHSRNWFLKQNGALFDHLVGAGRASPDLRHGERGGHRAGIAQWWRHCSSRIANSASVNRPNLSTESRHAIHGPMAAGRPPGRSRARRDRTGDTGHPPGRAWSQRVQTSSPERCRRRRCSNISIITAFSRSQLDAADSSYRCRCRAPATQRCRRAESSRIASRSRRLRVAGGAGDEAHMHEVEARSGQFRVEAVALPELDVGRRLALAWPGSPASMSIPSTRPLRPTRALSRPVMPPGPQPMSRQRHPARTPMRSSMISCVGRQRGGLKVKAFDLAAAMLDRVVAGKCFGRGDGHGSGQGCGLPASACEVIRSLRRRGRARRAAS